MDIKARLEEMKKTGLNSSQAETVAMNEYYDEIAQKREELIQKIKECSAPPHTTNADGIKIYSRDPDRNIDTIKLLAFAKSINYDEYYCTMLIDNRFPEFRMQILDTNLADLIWRERENA